jgi:hypothetical protein
LFSTHLRVRIRTKNNEKQQQYTLSHSEDSFFFKYNKNPAKYKKAGNRHGPAILVKNAIYIPQIGT